MIFYLCACTHISNTDELNASETSADHGEENEETSDSRPSHLNDIIHIPYRGLTVTLDETGDKFYNLVNDRRSIRKFNKNRTVERQIIEKCILAAGEIICIKYKCD